MRLAFVASFSAALLAGCTTLPEAAPAAAFTAAPLAAHIPSDLPRVARPLHYAITVEPDAAALRFAGQASIMLEVYQPTDALVLHAAELDIADAVLVDASGNRQNLAIALQPDRQTVSFTAHRQITRGTYRLETRYTGRINTQATGLFALDYPDKRTGESVRGLFTQFQAPDARRFAPMFDEPSYKATFELVAIVPAAQMAVGNAPIAAEELLGDGRKRVTFATSPLMSSYLLFFALGDFERASALAADGTQIGIVAPVGSGEQTRFALQSTLPMIPWFEEYFGAQYPLPKLDNVAAPGSSQFFGAMENWGAILTFENYLLVDPAITSPAQRRTIFTFLAHEVAHQWFGNIVTMAWWDDLWLNEGFASWLEAKVTHEFYPEWQQDLSRVSARERAMQLDGFANTHAVVQDIATVAELAQAFDDITYSKGEAVIAMFESHAGETVWQDGLRRYLARHAWGNTGSRDLWQAMEEAGATGLTAIAEDFTTQPGVPLVRAEGECVDGQTVLRLAQSEFSLDRAAEVSASPQHWLVPLRIDGGNGPAQREVLDGVAELHIEGCAAPLVINAGQAGYFRTIYSEVLSARQQAGFARLAPIDQLGLLRDAFALANADYQPLGPVLALFEAVPGDANPVVAGYAADSWAALYERLDDEHAAQRAQVGAIAQARWGPRLAALGFDPLPDEPLVDSELRADLIDAFWRTGDTRVEAEARDRLARLAEDPRALDGPLKSTWLAIAATGASAQEWELLARLAAESNSTSERQTYFALLGAARDEALARRALDFALTGAAGTSSAAIIDRVSGNHPELALDFALAHADAVRAIVDSNGWPDFLPGLAANSDDPAMIVRLEALRDALPADEAQPYTQVIDAMRVRLAERPRQQQALLDWLAARPG